MEKNWSRIWMDFKITICFISLSVLVGLSLVLIQQIGDRLTATLWALSCLASGGMIGFLFGIPRVLQDNNVSNVVLPTKDKETEGNTSQTLRPFYRMQVNTNLEQISDWLTKIIVGVGLIELRRIPEILTNLSAFLANGLGAAPQTQALAMALITYFIIVGFLGGYLITRIYLAQAFSRADWGTQNTINIGGSELTLEEVTEQQRKLLTDLQEQFLRNPKMSTDGTHNETAEEKVIADNKPQIKSILWVDDNPKNNSILIEQFTKLGIEVVISPSTNDALSKIESKKFGRIITDMGRFENSRYNNRAGLDFVNELKKRGIDTPVVIYCSPRAVATYREEALTAGAVEITSSSTILLQALQLNI
jgi:CheY-like chemotaxis protein